MAKLTQSVMLANRQKWIDKLLNKNTRKAVGTLDTGKGRRCCLGHACAALGVDKVKLDYDDYDPVTSSLYSYGASREISEAPSEVISMLGLWGSLGGTKNQTILKMEAIGFPDGLSNEKFGIIVSTLAQVNDTNNAKISPQMIGKYLQSVIKGGVNTPFKLLSSYPKD